MQTLILYFKIHGVSMSFKEMLVFYKLMKNVNLTHLYLGT